LIIFASGKDKPTQASQRGAKGTPSWSADDVSSCLFAGLWRFRLPPIAKCKMPKTQARGTSAEAQFEARIDGVRVRFALKLADRIQRTAAALPRMIENGSGAEDLVANAYRWFHDISGIAPTVGFEATGQSARSCDAVLVGPSRAQRGLSAAELALLTEGLEALRETAQAETQAMELNRRLAS
jgi:Hpt domain